MTQSLATKPVVHAFPDPTKVGLGSPYEGTGLSLAEADYTYFATTYYQATTYTTPLSDTAFDAAFGAGTISLVGVLNTGLSAVGNVSTNLSSGTMLNCCFFLKAVRLLFITPSKAFTVAGAAFPSAAGQQPFDGHMRPLIAQGPVPVPATFEYGGRQQEAFHAWSESMNFIMSIGCDYDLINTQVARMNCILSDAVYNSSGDMLISAMRKIRHGNDQAALNGSSTYFQPINAVTADEAAPAPVASVGSGGPASAGYSDGTGLYLVRKGQGVVLGPTQSFNAGLFSSPGSSQYAEQLRENLTDPIDVSLTPKTGMSAAPTGSTILDAGVRLFSFGLVRVGIELIGVKIRPNTAIDWALQCGGGMPPDYFESAANGFALAGINDAFNEFNRGRAERGEKTYRTLGAAVKDMAPTADLASGPLPSPGGMTSTHERDGRSHKSVRPFLAFIIKVSKGSPS